MRYDAMRCFTMRCDAVRTVETRAATFNLIELRLGVNLSLDSLLGRDELKCKFSVVGDFSFFVFRFFVLRLVNTVTLLRV